MSEGKIKKVAGPLVIATGMRDANMSDVVRVSDQKLIGEIIEMHGDQASIQVYEETSGLGPGEPVVSTGAPLSVELGPGLIGSIYDGIQRPLNKIMEATNSNLLARGVDVPALDREKKWSFTPTAQVGDEVVAGDILGTVQETEVVLQKIMVPYRVSGKITKLEAGEFTVTDPIAEITDADGEVDTFFPIAKGGTAAVPGPFGSGKTVVQHQLAKWADADIVVYIGCGERGNEMTDVLNEFPALKDPKTGKSLMQRTVLIANTSDMPFAAREASVYTGITIAEYFRDMGYSVALMADSTSRWAEALREMSGRLEEMPGEEGYPAYLGSRLAGFYERAGRCISLGHEGREGALSVIGAVSPAGGDISEPVTQATLRIVKVFWGLDANLAHQRHFPAINWLNSYSLYLDSFTKWFDSSVSPDWMKARMRLMGLLQDESEIQEIVQLVGMDAISVGDRLKLEAARSIREDFLHQNAFDDVDTYSSTTKQLDMMKLILQFYDESRDALQKGVKIDKLAAMPVREEIGRFKYVPEKDLDENFKKVTDDLTKAVEELVNEKEDV